MVKKVITKTNKKVNKVKTNTKANTVKENPIQKALLEKIAKLTHIEWETWSKELAKSENLTKNKLKTWKKLWVDYSSLPKTQKVKDLLWANKFMEIIMPSEVSQNKVKKQVQITKKLVNKKVDKIKKSVTKSATKTSLNLVKSVVKQSNKITKKLESTKLKNSLTNSNNSNSTSLYSKLDKDSFGLTRNGFGEGLLEAGKKNKNVVALCADLTGSVKVDKFADKYPNRFFEVGICEQNMMSMAAGMCANGKIPLVASYAAFNPGRNWDQLRVSVCYSNNNVKILGGHAGLTTGPRTLPTTAMVAPIPMGTSSARREDALSQWIASVRGTTEQ